MQESGGHSVFLFARLTPYASRTSEVVLTQQRKTSATLQACAIQPRGVKGASA